MGLRDHLRSLICWLASLHAPAGRWSTLVATGLFLLAGLSHLLIVYYLAYFSACLLLMLFAADLAKSFIDPGSFPLHSAPPMTWPMLVFRLVLTGIVGAAYSVCVWVGIGPWLPIMVYPVILVVCFGIAWRNLQLWYEQGAEFEQELAEEAARTAAHRPGAPNPQIR
jgi:hypothetical protein